MIKPTREEVKSAIIGAWKHDLLGPSFELAANAVMALYEDEPTTSEYVDIITGERMVQLEGGGISDFPLDCPIKIVKEGDRYRWRKIESDPPKPTMPKWQTDLSVLLESHATRPYSNLGLDISAFIREKLREMHNSWTEGEYPGEEFCKKWGIE